MPIDGGMRDKLEAGMVLVAKYKGTEYRADVVAGDDGKALFRLEDGRELKSPSSAASAVMNGQVANGWRFWSLQADAPKPAAKPAPKTRKARKPKAAAEPGAVTENEPTGEEVTTE